MDEDSATINITNDFTKSSFEGIYLGFVAIVLIAILIVIGNSLVLYGAYRKTNFGILRDLDIVIISLAINDLLIGLIGIPSRIFALWMQGSYDLKSVNNKGKCSIQGL